MGLIDKIKEIFGRGTDSSSTGGGSGGNSRSMWNCRRCGHFFSGSPICPRCGANNSKKQTVDDPADPTGPGLRFSIPNWAIYTALTLALTAGFVASGGVGVVGGLLAGAGGTTQTAVAVGVVAGAGLATAGSVEASPGVTQRKPNIADSEKQSERPGGKYYIYAVNTSGWSLYVGQPEDVEGRRSSSFTDGGTGDQPVAFKKLVDTPFDSREKALEHIKAGMSQGHQSYWTGTWVKFGGEEYRTLHVSEVNR